MYKYINDDCVFYFLSFKKTLKKMTIQRMVILNELIFDF